MYQKSISVCQIVSNIWLVQSPEQVDVRVEAKMKFLSLESEVKPDKKNEVKKELETRGHQSGYAESSAKDSEFSPIQY